MAGFRLTGGGRWPVGRFARLADLAAVAHGVTSRAGPDFGTDARSAATAAAAAATAAALDLTTAAWVHQVHGGVVLRAERGGLAGQADGLASDTPGLAVLGRSADCPLVLAAGRRDDGTWAVGFAHASWRATLARVTARLLETLGDELGVLPSTVRAAIAPSAGPCCYEVGDEVVEAARASLGSGSVRFFSRPGGGGGRAHFDLWAANCDQLLAAGVPAGQIDLSGVCTICGGERFWSWRREGPAAGRFAAAIGVCALNGAGKPPFDGRGA